MSTKKSKTFRAHGVVWLYSGETCSWHFVSLPKALSVDIRTQFGSYAKGWGSLPVSVTIGTTVWRTSLFPDTKAGIYMLPIKADVRGCEGIADGDHIEYTIVLLV